MASNPMQRGRSSRRGERSQPAPPRPSALTTKQRERRTRIVRAALEMLERSEFEDIQVRHVADTAEVALGTVYRYFRSKEHLFAAVLLEWNDSFERRQQALPLHGGPQERLTDLLDRIVDGFERRPQFYRLMTTIETTTDPDARDLFAEFSDRNRDRFLKAVDTLDPEVRNDVLDVVLVALGGNMRSWSLGYQSSRTVRSKLHRAVALIFSPPPTSIDGPLADQR